MLVFAPCEKHRHVSGDKTENEEELRAAGKYQNFRKGGEEEK